MKKKKITIIISVIGILIIGVCLTIQIILNNETKKLKEESKKYENMTLQTKSGQQIETKYT